MSINEEQIQSKSVKALFTPFHSEKLSTTNRIVMAPMTRGFSPNGVPGSNVAEYYRRRAEHGVGLIITEGTLVNHPAAASSPNYPEFHGEAALAGWKHVVDAVHQAGGKIFPQLWHEGTARKVGSLPNPEALPVSPSGFDLNGTVVNEPLSEKEVISIIDAFGQAAVDAKRLGFDGIEIHGAHGYLIDTFFWSQTNHRTDKYGGDLVSRTRFASEVIASARRAVGPDFPIGLRFSQWKVGAYTEKLAQNPAELERFLAPLVDAGVDLFHCSTRRFWEPEFADSNLNLAGWTKKITGKSTITVGSVSYDIEQPTGRTNATILDQLMERFDRGEFDLAAVGRSLLADPAWAEKVREGRLAELNPLSADSFGTLY